MPIHCLEWPGPGEPVFLIHGTTFCAAVWTPVARILAARHRLVAMDLRGHGASGKPADAYDTPDFIADLTNVLRELRLEGCSVLSHSLGANVAMAAYRERPGLFRKAVLVEPAFRLTNQHQDYLRKSAARFKEQSESKSLVWPDRETMFQAYRKKTIPSTWTEEALRAYIEGGTRLRDDGRFEIECPPDVERLLYSERKHQLLTAAELPDVTLPVLLLRGERTPRALRSMVDEAAPLLPNARLVVVPGATHFAPMERPDEVARLTVDFLAEP
ncbi:MAG: alpha/beta hydrolase [Chloroflexi bacterium]|nr:alpha/beta hydrolase [Chloroflexota bacterium]